MRNGKETLNKIKRKVALEIGGKLASCKRKMATPTTANCDEKKIAIVNQTIFANII